MKKYLIGSTVALSLFATTVSAKTFATVNGSDITEREIGAILQVIPGANFSQMTKEQKTKIIDQAIEKKLLGEKALKEGMEKEPEFQEALKSVKRDLALELWMKKQFEAIKLKDSEIKDFYKKNKAMFQKPETVKAKHILLTTEADAKAVIKELNGGAKFEDLAKTKSTGPSGPSGGDLGWFDKKRMVKEFSDAAFALKKGKYTKKPVKTQFGYHVILLEDKKPAGNVSLEEAKPRIEQSLKVKKFQENMKKMTKKLRSNADISIK
ncbi:MAG TPA: peptidylprolyl isomerase [Campylobacterales bacterium]|nr:peptidylprolyl isomerase [Campylobacterales bacterium]